MIEKWAHFIIATHIKAQLPVHKGGIPAFGCVHHLNLIVFKGYPGGGGSDSYLTHYFHIYHSCPQCWMISFSFGAPVQYPYFHTIYRRVSNPLVTSPITLPSM